MGVSIYYTATRDRPLTCGEQTTAEHALARYLRSGLLAECGDANAELDAESFCVYPSVDPTEPDVVFEGATKLTLCSEEAFWVSVQYWCRLLSEIRRAIPDATWHVHIDDADIPWDESAQAFDPSAG